MDENWKKEIENLPLEEQWHRLYLKTKPLRAPGKAMWKGGGIPHQDYLLKIFNNLGIKNFIDCGCADFFWLSKLDWTGINYLGIDIVPELIEQNKKMFPGFHFVNINIVKEFPNFVYKNGNRMIFIRDVFTHLQLADCLKIIENVKNSGAQYLMISSSSVNVNNDNTCLVIYPRNLRIKPFNFPEPLMTIKDKGKEGYYMGIWNINEL